MKKKNSKTNFFPMFKWVMGSVLAYVTFMVLIFKPFFFGDKFLKSDDMRLDLLTYWKSIMPEVFFGIYDGVGATSLGLGTPLQLSPTIENLIVYLLPSIVSMHGVFFFIIGLTLGGAMFFFHSLEGSSTHRFHPTAIVLSAFMLAFSPLYFSYIPTGHTGKLLALGFFLFAFGFAARLIRLLLLDEARGKLIKHASVLSLLTASSLALAFISGVLHGAIQTSFYFSLVFSAFFVLTTYQAIRKHSTSLATTLRQKAWWLVFPFLIVGLFLFLYHSHLKLFLEEIETGKSLTESTQTTSTSIPTLSESNTQMNDVQKWNWATQWSLPPIETIEFIVPGVFGYFTGSSTHPYWGKIGRTVGWEQHKRGYANYSSTSHYLGGAIFLLCLYTLFCVRRKILWFWGGVALLSLMLAYGRFFFVYKAFYALPFMSELRNPNKFLHVFHLAVSVLAAYGLNDVIKQFFSKQSSINKSASNKSATNKSATKNFQLSLIGVLAFLLILIIVLAIQGNSIQNNISKLFGAQQATLITFNMHQALIKAIGLYLLFALLFVVIIQVGSKQKNAFHLRPSLKGICLFVCSMLIFFDLYLINQNYFPFTKQKDYYALKENDVKLASFFKEQEKQFGTFRLKFFLPNNYLNNFLWNGAISQQLEVIDTRVARRGMPATISTYYQLLAESQQAQNSKKILLPYQLAGVRYGLLAKPFSYPELKIAFYHSVSPTSEDVFVYQVLNSVQRIYLVNKFREANNLTNIFDNLAHSNFNAQEEVVLYRPSDEVKNLLTTNNSSTANLYNITPIPLRGYELRKKDQAITNTAAIMLLNTYFDHKWQAYATGINQQGAFTNKKLSHFPANYLFNGFLVPDGAENVVVRYQKNALLFVLTLLSYAILLGSFIFWYFLQKKENTAL